MQRELGKYVSPKESLPRIRGLLNTLSLSNQQKEKILHCVEFHEEYDFSLKGKTVNDLETLIVQDADNLDAMGAIGIGRTFSYGGAHKIPMWLPEIPFDREFYTEEKNDVSTIHHFYSKIFKLKNNMNTVTAKKIAKSRHKFTETFLKEFLAEWRGKK